MLDRMQRQDLQDVSQGEAAYLTLHEAIRAGDYQPGDRLREADVAERLSLSRTPVREALRKLESDGIVEHRARIGAVIRTLSQPEVVGLYEMRVVLERTAAQMAAQHASRAEVDTLSEINERIAQAKGDAQTAAALNQDFHRCIYHATRNCFLLESARALNNALLLLGPTTMADEARIEVVCEQHDAIITAIGKRDGEAAGSAAETHLQTSLRHRLRVMR